MLYFNFRKRWHKFSRSAWSNINKDPPLIKQNGPRVRRINLQQFRPFGPALFNFPCTVRLVQIYSPADSRKPKLWQWGKGRYRKQVDIETKKECVQRYTDTWSVSRDAYFSPLTHKFPCMLFVGRGYHSLNANILYGGYFRTMPKNVSQWHYLWRLSILHTCILPEQ